MSSLDDLYRRVIMDHYQRPRNRGELNGEALTVNLNNPSCGDKIQLQMLVNDDKITDVKFLGEGCSISMSSASMMTQAVKGLSVEDALRMVEIFTGMMKGAEPEDVDIDLGDIEALQGVAKFPARINCAMLAWKALQQGVREKAE
ncbi:SUF system NifU family Fe-S cluster assembly protein [Ammoniphilus oxalaticus]|uniref:SUF system NifU family Fe-S cluster assembly protein n=1 Tax=Ammoniphilus oxalaticus TaxID=66863 RepID=A0A419SET8_9BACL|nr:SUF system NifU family Fe-S cluster assembly protein [Ammoniphilus oxalaticus]RKD21734.1 SUF system NifU family Fe-S cluster assembly protein [Ammoniphilus oxalaticus]